MADCAEIRAELGVYVLGAIIVADRARVVRHLASCQRCRDQVAWLAALPGLLRRLPAETAAQLIRDSTPARERDQRGQRKDSTRAPQDPRTSGMRPAFPPGA